MSYLIFDRIATGGKTVLRATSDSYNLAGYNLLHSAWKKRGSQVDAGWHVTADELISIHTNGRDTAETKRLVIDTDPRSTSKINLIELLDVYAFTWGDGSGGASWTPIMLRMRDLFCKEYDSPIDQTGKSMILSQLREGNPASTDFVEFMYLNGPADGWKWDKKGNAKALFLQGAARDYFRRHF